MKKHTKRRRPLLLVLLIAALLSGYAYYALQRELPALQPVAAQTKLQSHTDAGSFLWPSYGMAAVGVADTDILVTNGAQKPLPTASTAKVITALAILAKKPLQLGQSGPTLTLTDADVDIYNRYVAVGGSVIPVSVGEKITEYQALQALMLPSANNISDTLAIWAFGTHKNYHAFATNYVKQLGMTSTTIGSDASGLAPDSASTARDLVLLGKAAMNHPVLASIVGQPTATGIPEVGTVNNVNFLLGISGIVGIKTGNTDEAGGVFLSASNTVVAGKSLMIITAVLGAPNLGRALNDSVPLIRSAQNNFSTDTLVPANNIVGRYRLPWGGSVAAITQSATTATAWKGSAIPVTVQLQPIEASERAGQTVGLVSAQKSLVSGGSRSPVVLAESPAQPSVWWRLTHGF